MEHGRHRTCCKASILAALMLTLLVAASAAQQRKVTVSGQMPNGLPLVGAAFSVEGSSTSVYLQLGPYINPPVSLGGPVRYAFYYQLNDGAFMQAGQGLISASYVSGGQSPSSSVEVSIPNLATLEGMDSNYAVDCGSGDCLSVDLKPIALTGKWTPKSASPRNQVTVSGSSANTWELPGCTFTTHTAGTWTDQSANAEVTLGWISFSDSSARMVVSKGITQYRTTTECTL